MSALLAALRDCSFSAREPRGRPRVVYHALVWHGEYLMPACGCGFHIEETEEPARGLLESEKCRASGCRQAFARDAEETP